MSDISN